jgi:hypothetical protein
MTLGRNDFVLFLLVYGGADAGDAAATAAMAANASDFTNMFAVSEERTNTKFPI